MKEIGGFFQLEINQEKDYYPKAIKLNSARNCLRYIIRAYKIKKIWAPAYTCPVVWEAIHQEGCSINFYSIDANFLPTMTFSKQDYILYTNYFGVCGKNVDILSAMYPNVIIDNSQSFYSAPKGLASFNSPRKFFGVPDGGYLFMNDEIPRLDLLRDNSLERFSHLVRRIELGASCAYADFRREDSLLDNAPICKMSLLTETLLQGIDYKKKKERRNQNFEYLSKNLKKYNLLNLESTQGDVPMVYPLLIKKADIRQYLINNKIYVATYWKDQKDTEYGKQLEEFLVPLPIDQRYSLTEMDFMLKLLSYVI